MIRSLRVPGFVVAVLAAACGAHGSGGTFSSGCTTGQTQSCTCANGASGTQTCDSTMLYGACVCDGSDGGTTGMDASTQDLPALPDIQVPVDRGTSPVDTGSPPGPGTFGAACTRLAECASGVCIPNGRCSHSCASAGDCPSSIGWSCTSLPGLGAVCNCTPRGPEVCNGLDDDCNGLADDGIARCGSSCVDLQTDALNCGACGIACGGGTSCVHGSCACPSSAPTACGGRCVNALSDPTNCGACGVTCPAGQPCSAGHCSTVTAMCPSTCVATSQCDPCHAATDPAGSGYCCVSGLCIFSMSGSCALDSGLPDVAGLLDTSGPRDTNTE